MSADTDWERRGACRDFDPDLFFPVSAYAYQEIEAARAICAECPVKQECLDHALAPDTRQDFGIWGGKTEQERRRILRHGRQSAVPVNIVRHAPRSSPTRPTPTSAYHDQIMTMRSRGDEFADIAAALELNVHTLKAYWYKHSRPAPEAPVLTPIQHPPGHRPRPSEHRDVIQSMLTDTSYAYSYKQVAYVIGCSPHSVKTYWHRFIRPLIDPADRKRVAA